jgi:thymidylate synthase
MKQYLDIVEKILTKGEQKENRTGVDTIAVAGAMFEHDMSEGFPLLTTKKMYFKGVKSELEFFIKGLTDKKWLQEENNHIWDEWCTPKKVSYGNDEESKKKMKDERDLGPIYGFQWRHWNANYDGFDKEYSGKGIDQLEKIVNTLKKNPNDRRMIVSAWNPEKIPEMALPPCHYGFQVTVINDKLNLLWNQRSVDTMLGLPFNIASYGLLLHLLAKESGFKEGKLVGFLGDVHIYKNHLDGAKEQLKREPFGLPKIITENFTSIFDWKYGNSKLEDYKSHPPIKFEIAV